MDIIDIVLARAFSAQGSIEDSAQKASKAAADAAAAVEQVNSIITDIEDTKTYIEDVINDIDAAIGPQIRKLALDLSTNHLTNADIINLSLNYDQQTLSTVEGLIKYYTTIGQNTDGTMTQKAISDALEDLQRQIDAGGGGSGGTIHLDPDDAGKITIVDSNGNLISGSVTEAQIIEALLNADLYHLSNAAGVAIDYTNKTFSRTQEGAQKLPGNDFSTYLMYGGRRRCNVSDDGRITAWLGDANYTEDGSNGQVMVYQPKFYYLRVPMVIERKDNGTMIVRKEQLIISPIKQSGLKIHPLFVNEQGQEVDYVLLSAYEGCNWHAATSAYDLTDSNNVDFSTDKLSSIANAKPISGVNKNFTLISAEQLAKNRGAGWHITTLAAESANQMLFATEYCSLNSQNNIGLGITNISSSSNYNCSSLTGSTASLGNGTGIASSTINEINGTQRSYSDNGRTAVSYRGMENLWGNMWRIIGNLKVLGGQNGIIYICKDYNYDNTDNINNYNSMGYPLPSDTSWISGFAYNAGAYDWTYLPAEATNANSALPVGDTYWGINGIGSHINVACIGGQNYQKDQCGLFNYACDRYITDARNSHTARLMFIPTINSIYQANLTSFNATMM